MKGMRLAIIWAYVSEMLLAATLYGLNLWWAGDASIFFFIQKTAVAWANFTGVLFAASLTVWVAFINITATDFGEYLRKRNVYFVYSMAFVTALVSFFVSTVMLIASAGTQKTLIANIAYFLLIFALINVITMVRNATGLVSAYARFKDLFQKAIDEVAQSKEKRTKS